MPATLIEREARQTGRLSTSLRRYCGDWLAQLLWAVENGLEEPVNLHTPPRSYKPRPRGVLDRHTGKVDPNLYLRHPRVAGPQLLAYVCHLPPEMRLGFAGKRIYLYTADVPRLRQLLETRGLLAVWETYSEGGTYQIYAYHRASGSMQLTPKARATKGIGQAAEALADWFEPQVLAGG